MSYGFTLNFISVKDKLEAYETANKIVEDRWLKKRDVIKYFAPFAPSARFLEFGLSKPTEEDCVWMALMFNTNFTYWEDLKLLAVSGEPKIFPKDMEVHSVYFQNSTDQDYDYQTWENICPEFTEAIKRCKMLSDKEAILICSNDRELIENQNIKELGEYFRKSMLYKDIFKLLDLDNWMNCPNAKNAPFFCFTTTSITSSDRAHELHRYTRAAVNAYIQSCADTLGFNQ